MFWNKTSKPITTTTIGELTESIAKNYLEAQGLQFQQANFSSKAGEIDLIMLEEGTLVFVEVKYRKSAQFGGAISAVSKSKQQKIKKCAQFYLQQLSVNEYNSDCRFDVVALDGDINHPDINWLKNAF